MASSAFEQAVALHRQGNLTQAEALYRQILVEQPENPFVVYQLGIAALQQGHAERGIDLLNQAIALSPDEPIVHVNLGRALLRLRRPQQALASFDRALSLSPKAANVLAMRGDALMELGEHAEALASYESALQLDPEAVEVLNNRATALLDLGRAAAALESLDRALRLRPDFVEARYNRGNALRDLGRFAEAIECYDQVVRVRPAFSHALNNRGMVQMRLGQKAEAVDSFQRALQVDPAGTEALNNLANALIELRRPLEALGYLDRALLLDPDSHDSHNNRGNALMALQRPEEALASYQCALTARPQSVQALNNMANAFMGLKRAREALASLDHALHLDPDCRDALHNRGNVLVRLRRPEEALTCFERALQIKPDVPDTLESMGATLEVMRKPEAAAACFARILEVAPDYDYALGNELHARLHACDWQRHEYAVDRIVESIHRGRRAIMPGPFLAVCPEPSALLKCARIHARDQFAVTPAPLWTGERYQHKRIRVAYLSADFHAHATAFLMAELFEKHDKEQFEITAISYGPDSSDDMRVRLLRAFDRFIDVRAHSDGEVAGMLRQMEVDIAVDLKGFTTDARTGILAYRPAPVQVNYLGYPGTMGLDFIDYIIADPTVIPVEQQAHYSEKIAYLPDCYQPNDSRRAIAAQNMQRADFGLPQSGFVFCCFNKHYKISPDVFRVWMRLLNQAPGSVLWLLEGNADSMRNLRHEAQACGVAPERLVFAPRMPLDRHLARYRMADLFLDTLPYNAHTTASDALWAGVPVLTRQGKTFSGRVAASLLNSVGLPELITGSLEEYEALALSLATTQERLQNLRARLALARDTCPLFDSSRFCRNLEKAYQTMWRQHQTGLSFETFEVPRND